MVDTIRAQSRVMGNTLLVSCMTCLVINFFNVPHPYLQGQRMSIERLGVTRILV